MCVELKSYQSWYQSNCRIFRAILLQGCPSWYKDFELFHCRLCGFLDVDIWLRHFAYNTSTDILFATLFPTFSKISEGILCQHSLSDTCAVPCKGGGAHSTNSTHFTRLWLQSTQIRQFSVSRCKQQLQIEVKESVHTFTQRSHSERGIGFQAILNKSFYPHLEISNAGRFV